MCFASPLLRHWRAGFIAWIALSATLAEAVIIPDTYDAPSLVAPGNDPGWSNLAYLNGASAVYLGGGWMITANHVGSGDVQFTDGRMFPFSVASNVRVINPPDSPVFGDPDLLMFRVTGETGLPSLDIAATSAPQGASVMMIGASRNRFPELVGWNANWAEVPFNQASRLGFKADPSSPRQMRWGVNNVTTHTVISQGSTLAFATQFDRPSIPFEAQAMTGDSGGGVFQLTDGVWKLVGIMDMVQPLLGQPAQTAVFGNQTLSVDLAPYREQILQIMARSPWQNQVTSRDVNRSGSVTPQDALIIINDLISLGVHPLAGAPSATDFLLDVDGSRIVSPTDALNVINAIEAASASSAALTASAQPTTGLVPEPSAAALLIAGALAALAARAGSRPRRSRR